MKKNHLVLNEQIERLRTLVRKCYGAVAGKNGTVPEVGERNMENLPAAIGSIGSKFTDIQPSWVTFYDFDGTILASYTREDIDTLTFPPAPNHDDMEITFTEWSASLDDIKASRIPINVCARYTSETDQLYISVLKDNTTLTLTQNTSGRMSFDKVDWGDGSEDTNITVALNHQYSRKGNYVIKIYSSLGSCIGNYDIQSPYNPDIQLYGIIQADSKYYKESYSYIVGRNGSSNEYNYLKWVVWNRTPIHNGAAHTAYIPNVSIIDVAEGSYWYSGFPPLARCVSVNGLSITYNVPVQNIYNISSAKTFTIKHIQNSNIDYGAVSSNLEYLEYLDCNENYPCYTISQSSTKALMKIILPHQLKRIEQTGNYSSYYFMPMVVLPSTMEYLGRYIFNGLGKNCDTADIYIFVKNVNQFTLSNKDAFTMYQNKTKIHISPESTYTAADGTIYKGVEAWEKATNWSAYAGYYVADLDEYDYDELLKM